MKEIKLSQRNNSIILDADRLILSGRLQSSELLKIESLLDQLLTSDLSAIKTIDARHLEYMDTNIAWMIIGLFKQYTAPQAIPPIVNVSPKILKLWNDLVSLDAEKDHIHKETISPHIVAQNISNIGSAIENIFKEFYLFISFISQLLSCFARLLLKPKNIRFKDISAQIYKIGVEAVAIVILIAFSISFIIALLVISPLSDYGIEHLTPSLVTIGILREMAVLLTAIMIAGRSGSAFAAELGAMKINEETLALKTLGLDIYEVLVIPRLIGTIISICLLTIISDFFGLVANGFISIVVLDFTIQGYINEILQLDIAYSFMLGFVRAPFYGFMVACIGCFRGLQVRHSAQEVGINTTAAVVQSIFTVVILHAVFSISFKLAGLI